MACYHAPTRQDGAPAFIGPVLKSAIGYAFATWTEPDGLQQGYPYRRIEDAIYARNAALSAARASAPAIACRTQEEFLACRSVRGSIPDARPGATEVDNGPATVAQLLSTDGFAIGRTFLM